MINLLDLQPNKVSKDLTQYPITIMGLTGHGKTYTTMKILESFTEDGRKPLFLMFEDRYLGIPGIMAQRIHNIPELLQITQQLKNPQIKEKFSCIVIDTVQKFESMAITYTVRSKDAEIIDDIGKYGKGTKYYRNTLQIIEDIKNTGLPVHYIVQAEANKDEDDNVIYRLKTNDKNTLKPVTQDSYMIGFLWNETNDKGETEYKLTFQKSNILPDLKDTFGVPAEIKYQDIKEEILKVIDDLGEENITNETTMQDDRQEIPFEKLIEQGNNLGRILYENERFAEAESILKTNIGVDEDGNVKRFDSLIESQKDVAEVVVIKLQELVDKYKLKEK